MAEDEEISTEYGGRKKPYSAFAEDTQAMSEQMQAKLKEKPVAVAMATPKKKKLRKVGGGKLRPVDGIGAEGDESL